MIDLKIEGRAIYLKMGTELLKEHRLELENAFQQVQASDATILILDISVCRTIEEYCLRPLIQLQACVRAREGGNVFIVGAKNSIKRFLLIKGAIRDPETYSDMNEMKLALLA